MRHAFAPLVCLAFAAACAASTTPVVPGGGAAPDQDAPAGGDPSLRPGEVAPLAAGAHVAPGARIAGHLDAASPRSPRSGVPMAVYDLEVPAAGGIELHAISFEFDTYLSLYAPDGALVTANDDVRGNTNARIQTFLDRPGTYRAVVSAQTPTDSGSFRLEVSRLAFSEPAPLTLPGEIVGLLHAGKETMFGRNTFHDRFLVTLAAPTTVQIDMSSEIVDPYLFVTDERGGQVLAQNDDVAAGNLDAQIILELGAGTHAIWATTADARSHGLYRLSIRELPLRAGGRLKLPADHYGRLAAGDPARDGRREHRYALEVTAAGTVRIDLGSRDFDARLQLHDARGTLVAENDDAGPSTTDAQIVAALTPGTYDLVVTQTSGGPGVYRLTAQVLSPTTAGPLPVPAEVAGHLSAQSEVHETRRTAQDRYQLRLDTRRRLGIDLRSTDFDAYLLLVADDGRIVAQNDDADGQTTNARLELDLPPGDYQVLATSLTPGETGFYELSIQAH